MKDIESSPPVSSKRPSNPPQLKKAETRMERLLVAAGAAKRTYKRARAEFKQAKKAAKQARKEFEALSLSSEKAARKPGAKKSKTATASKPVATAKARSQAKPPSS